LSWRLAAAGLQGSPAVATAVLMCLALAIFSHTGHGGVAVDGSSRLLILLRILRVQAAMLRSSSSNSEFTSSAVRFINVIFTLRRVQWFLAHARLR